MYPFIANLPDIQKDLLLSVYNQIWIDGIYPDVWPKSIAIPLQKPGKDPTQAQNYRFVSLTSCLSKVLEKMVTITLMWYLDKNNCLSMYQSGFRKNRSTIDQLVQLENAIQNSFAAHKHLIAVFFDVEKAFDTTWRHGIIKTLHEWGMRAKFAYIHPRVFEKSHLQGTSW